jgi:hypothetical protein
MQGRPAVVQRDKEAGGKADAGVSSDEGGPPTVDNIEHDLRDILLEWQIGANEGVTQFVTNDLSDRLDQLESGNWNSFVAGLVGNTLWASTVFLGPATGVAFALSMGGIAIAAAPGVPHKSKSALPEVTKLATTYINTIFAGLNGQLREKAAAVLKEPQMTSRHRALAHIVRNSFKDGLYDIDPTYAKIPQINQNEVRDFMVDFAKERLDIVTQVGEMHSQTHMIEHGMHWTESHITEVAWIVGGPRNPLRLARLNTELSGEGKPRLDINFQDLKYNKRTFLAWVSKENQDAAIQQWVTKNGHPPATYKGDVIEKLPAA